MKPARDPSQRHLAARPPADPLLFMAVAGLFFFIVIVKLGVPVILDAHLDSPTDFWDVILGYNTFTWHVKWGYLLMIPVFLTGLLAIRAKPLPKKMTWLLLLPLVWLGWQFVAGSFTTSTELTRAVIAHFSACVGLFYLGFFALRGVRNPWPIWAGFGLALCWVLHIAMTQHFGGLEADRKATLAGTMALPKELLNNPATLPRLLSDRVFGSFMYPNSLAAGILLFLPVTLVYLWQVAPKVRPQVRGLFVAIFGGCGLACLYWSGSKAAFLFMVCLGVIALLRSPLSVAWKRALVYGILILGVIGFTIKYVDSAARGKRSMEARLVYWQAALKIVRQHPIVGTGPGTFGPSYSAIRPPGAEPAKLTHNDYLEQASDSGVFGSIAFVSLILGSLYCIYRYRLSEKSPFFRIQFSVWLGLVGLFLHSCMEFNSYYPALAWPAFFLLGWLLGLPEEAA